MKNWIKDIKDDDIIKILDNKNSKRKMPSDMNEKMLLELKKFPQRAIEEKKTSHLVISKPYFKFALAALLLITVSISVVFLIFKSDFFINKNMKSKVILTNNDVYIEEKGRIKKFKQDDKVIEGQVIKTEMNSECTIEISNRAVIDIKEKTSVGFLKLKEGKTIKLKLNKGQISVKVDNKIKDNFFQIITNSAVISVIGTEFSVSVSDNEEIKVDVISGKVKVEPVFLKDKEKYIILKRSESLIFNKKKIIKMEEVDEIKNNEDLTADVEKIKSKELSANKIYTYNNPDEKDQNDILSFTSSGNYLISQTRSSILCFNKDGKLIWNNVYGKSKGLMFMSVPTIYKNKIYISSINKKLLILNLFTGKEEKIIDTQGNIAFGYKIVDNKNKLYIPYTNGLYTFDLQNSALSENPVIQIKNPTNPIFSNNKVYISSFVDKSINAYNENGENIWNFILNSRSFCPPVLFGDYLVIGDDSGSFYKFSLNGNLINEIMLPDGITSSYVKNKNMMYALLNNGIIYKIDTVQMSYKKLFKVDDIPDVSGYLFKKPVIINNKLYIGTDKGKLIIYNINSGNKEKELIISDIQLSSPVFRLGENLFIGNRNGEIYLLN